MKLSADRRAEARARCEGRVPWTVDPEVEDFCVAYEDGICDRDTVETVCDRATCDLAIQHQPYWFKGPRWVECGDGEYSALCKADAEGLVADHNELADLLDDLDAAMAVVRAARRYRAAELAQQWDRDNRPATTVMTPADHEWMTAKGALDAALAALGEAE